MSFNVIPVADTRQFHSPNLRILFAAFSNQIRKAWSVEHFGELFVDKNEFRRGKWINHSQTWMDDESIPKI